MVKLEPIYLLYDERMLLHRPVGWVEPEVFPSYLDDIDDDYPMENPERLKVIIERLCNLEKRLLHMDESCFSDLEHSNQVFRWLECEMATKEQILLTHSEDFYERLDDYQFMSDSDLALLSQQVRHDIYYGHESFQAARLAAGGLLSCVNAVCDGASTTKKSLALVRPPGHHACQSQEMGFCFINSVVVAAKYALATGQANRIAILDWDVHDGNGTADATIDDENIFRIDLHRYNPREGFYPNTGPPTEVGGRNAKGLNLNLAWSQGGMRNNDYAAAFYELILPLLVDYNPDLLIISCGLDAAMGDLLGGCELTPGFFHAMTKAALEAVGPETPVVCALEGGYAMNVIPHCMEAVTLAMLNCPYSYHSSASSFCGGAAKRERWPSDRLERSRLVLSKYYIRKASSMVLYSAVEDINTSIKIFQGLSRWKHVTLEPIVLPRKLIQRYLKHAKRKRKEVTAHENAYFEPVFQRPRIYLWYGTEEWHRSRYQRVW